MLQEAGAPVVVPQVGDRYSMGGTLYWDRGQRAVVNDRSELLTCLRLSHLPRYRYLLDDVEPRPRFTSSLIRMFTRNQALTTIDFLSEDLPFDIECFDYFCELIRSCPNLQSFRFYFSVSSIRGFEPIMAALAESSVVSVDLMIPDDPRFSYQLVRNLLLKNKKIKSLSLGRMSLDDAMLCDFAEIVQSHPAIESVAFDRSSADHSLLLAMPPAVRLHLPVIQDTGVRALIAAFNENPRLQKFDLTSLCFISDAVFDELRELLLNRLGLPVDLGLDKSACLSHKLVDLEPLYLLAIRMQTHVQYLRAPGPKDPVCLRFEKARLKHYLETDPAAKDIPYCYRREFYYLLGKSYAVSRFGLYASASGHDRVDADMDLDGGGAAAAAYPG